MERCLGSRERGRGSRVRGQGSRTPPPQRLDHRKDHAMTKPASHCGRLLAVLSDGKWHSTAELYSRLGGMVLHSRISELRKRGYEITMMRVPGPSSADSYHYKLVKGA
jgi:hypothetical protein